MGWKHCTFRILFRKWYIFLPLHSKFNVSRIYPYIISAIDLKNLIHLLIVNFFILKYIDFFMIGNNPGALYTHLPIFYIFHSIYFPSYCPTSLLQISHSILVFSFVLFSLYTSLFSQSFLSLSLQSAMILWRWIL